MAHEAGWPIRQEVTLFLTSNTYTTIMSSLEPDQCNTKEFYIQRILNAYNSKQYLNILKIACTFAIPYSIMKNCVSGKILQIKI